MRVSLISLNLNGAAFLENFLESVRVEIEGIPDIELILLDNGSSDNSVSMLLNDYPWVRLIQEPRNLGFTGGCHKAAVESDSEYLVFMNNDMQLEPGFLNEILKPFEEDTNLGAVGGLILNETGSQVDYAGGDVNLFGWGFQRHHMEQVSVIEEEYFDNHTPRQFFACGGAVAMKRETWIQSGGFDPDFFAFFEDVDLGWRLNLMGLKTVLATEARVFHKHHGTASAMPVSFRSYLLERNSLMTLVKNYDDENLARIFPWAVAMANERGLIETESHAGDVFRGRWAEDVFSQHSDRSGPDVLKEFAALKRAGLKKAKEMLRKDSTDRKNPVRYLAVEYVFQNWGTLMKTRQQVQNLRKLPDSEIFKLMGEKYRTVLGHQREKNLMEVFKRHVQV